MSMSRDEAQEVLTSLGIERLLPMERQIALRVVANLAKITPDEKRTPKFQTAIIYFAVGRSWLLAGSLFCLVYMIRLVTASGPTPYTFDLFILVPAIPLFLMTFMRRAQGRRAAKSSDQNGRAGSQ
jgi:hypothetical protein